MSEKPKGIPHRWNWQEAVDGAEVCRGEHDRSRECEWETWEPEGAHSGDVATTESVPKRAPARGDESK